jgi:hypothetical protein
MGLTATIGVHLLEGMFGLGAMGSLVVLILTGIEDVETLLGKDSHEY